MPTLSICYATFNRLSYLEKSIESLVDNLRSNNLKLEIELVVVDSSDGSSAAVERLCCKYRNVFNNVIYQWLEPNGTDSAYKSCVSLSNSEYIWFLADDDIISDDLRTSLPLIVTSLEKGLSVLMNMSLYSSSLEGELINSLCDCNKSPRKVSLNSILEYAGNLPSHISFVIFPRDKWRYYERNFPIFAHLRIAGINLAVALEGYIAINSPIIKLRSGMQSWTRYSYNIWYQTWPSLLLYLDCDIKTILNFDGYKHSQFIRNLLLYKATGSFITSNPCLFQFMPYSHHMLLKIARFLPLNSCIRISIVLSAFARFPSISLSPLIKQDGI